MTTSVVRATKSSGVSRMPRDEVDQVAQAAVGAHELGHHGADHGQGDADLEPAQQHRHGRRNLQLGEDLPAAGLQRVHQR